jgi:hypothetical protein
MVEDLKAKSSPTIKEPVNLLVGGEGRENSRKARRDVWKRILSDLWRSDVCYPPKGEI